MSKPLRAVIYARVSTEEQATSGLGLDAQLDAARTAIERRGWTVDAVFTDEGVGGKIAPTDRPGLGRAMDLLCDGNADVLVASKLDRLSRDADHLPALMRLAEKCDFKVLALDMDVDTTTPVGWAVFRMVALFAELERNLIRDRTKAALAAKKAQGFRLGRPCTTSPELRARCHELRSGGLSYAEIAEHLQAEGYRNGRGSPYSRTHVANLCRSARLDIEAERARATPRPAC